MRPIATYTTWTVCVCLYIILVAAKAIDMPFGAWTRKGLMTHVLGGYFPRKGALLDSSTWTCHTCPRLISSTSGSFAFELAASVIFNSQNMLSKLQQTASVAFCTGN